MDFQGEAGPRQRPLLAPRGPAGAERRLRAVPGAGGSACWAELLAHAVAVALHHAAPVEAAQAVLPREARSPGGARRAAAQQVAAAEVRGAAAGGAAKGARRTRAPAGGRRSRASRRHRAGQRGPAA